MKRNIDLTANRDFADNADEPISWGLSTALSNFLGQHIGILPWDIGEIYSDFELTTTSYGVNEKVFPTGNKHDIRRWEKENTLASPDTCDRCGIQLIKIPWYGYNSLCPKCSDWLDKHMNKLIPWEGVYESTQGSKEIR